MSVSVGSATGYLDLDISGFLAGLKTAQSEAEKASSNIVTKVGKNLDSVGKKMTSAGTTLTKGFTVPIIGVGTVITKMSSDFESAMSRVQAISGASGKDLEALNKKAQELGATTAFSASEVADGMTEMAKAGWNSQQIMAGMEGVLNAASASGEDLANVSTIVADAITGFGMEASEATKVADLLTQAANAGTIDINDLGESFKYIAPVAQTMGFSIEDVTTAISAMSMSGIKGSQAGTSLRTMLTRMVKPTDAVAEAMDDLGIVLTNSDGSFKSLNQIVSEMRGKFSGMTDEQKSYYATTLAGQEGMSGLLSLLNLTEEEYNAISDSMNNANGVAKETANVMLNNLGGQVTILKSSLEGLAIQFGEIILPYLKQFVQWIQDLTTKLQQMTPEQKEQVVKWAAIAAAIGPVLVIVGKLVSGIGGLITVLGKVPGAVIALSKGVSGMVTGFKNIGEAVTLARAGFPGLASQASTLGAAIGGITAPVAAVVAIIGALVAAFVTLWNTNDGFKQNIIGTWNEIKETVCGFCDGIVERINALGFDFESITEVLGALWMGFCDLVAPIFEGAFSAVSTILSTVLDVITGILDVFIGLFTGNWDQLWLGVKEIFGGLWNGIVGIFQSAIDIIYGIANTVCSWFGTTWNNTWQSIKDFFANTWNNILTFFQEMGTNISNAFSSFIDTIVQFFSNLPYNIGYLLGLAIGHVIKFAMDLGTNAIQAGQAFIDNLINFVQTAPQKIADWLANAIAKVISWAADFRAKAKQAGSDFVDNVITTIKNLPSTLWTWLTNTAKKVVEWGPKLLQKGKDAIGQLKDGIVDAATSLPGKLKEIGSNVVSGVWNGIKGAKDKFVQDVKDFFGGIVDGVKDFLGIHSPSRVFEKEIGQWMPAGAAAGFKKAMPAAVKDMQSALDKGISELSADDTTVDATFTVESFADKAKKIYEDVANWFAKIDESLKSSVDSMSQSLQILLDTGMAVVNTNDDLGYIGLGSYQSSKSRTEGNGGDVDDKTPQGGGNTYNFYSNTSLSATECKREMEKAQEEMAFGI